MITIKFENINIEHQYIILKSFLDENIQKSLDGKRINKIIYIPYKLINFVTE